MEDNKFMTLDGLDGYQFEELIAKIMKKRGYVNIVNTQKSQDFGKDIIMDDSKGNRIVVECKHQHFIGRPIVQKLQGAMNHELAQDSSKTIKGIIVTSGNFSKEAKDYVKQISQDVELIDGSTLKKICRDLNLFILNGKVQIIINKSFENITEFESKSLSKSCYSKIYGHELLKSTVKSAVQFRPTCYIRYHVEFDTHTSVGCVDSYQNSGNIVVDGVDGKHLSQELSEFLYKERFSSAEINEKYSKNKTPYEFTENDIEEQIIHHIIDEHTHSVSYRGNNNVSYTKECIPKKRDIDLKEFIPLYVPVWSNELKISKYNYPQKFYVNGKKQLFIVDSLKICKICDKIQQTYQDMSLCPECGRIVCSSHRKIDYLDKKTPICKIHAKPFKLFIQKKYFASKNNLKKYELIWNKLKWWRKVYEDKILFSSIIIVILGGLYTLLNFLGVFPIF